MSAAKQRRELVIPSWPGRTGTEQWTGRTYNTRDFGTLSYWLFLRAVNPADLKEYQTTADRVPQNLGIWVYVSTDGCVCVDVRAHEIHSAQLAELELTVATLKRLQKRADKAGFPLDHMQRTRNIEAQLVKACHALGITRTIQYRQGADDKLAPIGALLASIARDIEQDIQRIHGGWKEEKAAA